MQHIRTGKYGEALARNWLGSNGFAILLSNWRCGRYEIDIVAEKNNLIHCVEVKTTRTTQFGWPENKLTAKKWRNLQKASAELMQRFNYEEIQMDVLSIVIIGKNIEYLWIENIGYGDQLQAG